MTGFIKFIDEKSLGDYKENVSFKTLTTYKTGGNARVVFYPSDVNCLKEALKFLKKNNISLKYLEMALIYLLVMIIMMVLLLNLLI